MTRREGSITQRSKGSWQARYYGPPDANGRQKQVNETVTGTKKEAEGQGQHASLSFCEHDSEACKCIRLRSQ